VRHPDGVAPPLPLGIAVAAGLIVAETLVVYLLTRIAPDGAFGVVYLLSVLVVATGWGLGLTVTTAVASALAFVCFRNWPAVGGDRNLPCGCAVGPRPHRPREDTGR
jgi:hypothetical protein